MPDSFLEEDNIEIIGASENNLKGINVSIPKGKLVVLAGVSGSGKSSLAFDIIGVESCRQWQATFPLYLRNKMPHYERPKVESILNLPPAIIVDQKAFGVSSRSNVGTAVDVAPLVRLLFSRIGSPNAGGSMAYSFNHPQGMCPVCTGLGEKLQLDTESIFDQNKSLKEGAILFSPFASGWQSQLYLANPFLQPDKKLKDYSEAEWNILRNGMEKPLKIELISYNTGRTDKVDYEGVIPRFERLYLNRDISKLKKSLQAEILSHVHKAACEVCGGTGLNPKALASKINNINIVDYFAMPVADLQPLLATIGDPVGKSIARQISGYIERMIDLGIGYLALGRKTDTLSGGEIQRLKIARHLGSSLSNVTYVFDEPTAGLHPADADRIGNMLLKLRDKHNNVLVVEHNRRMIDLADHIIEMGPEAGANGGRIVYQGNLEGLKNGHTITAKSLRQKIKINPAPLAWNEAFVIEDAHCHNLKHINVKIPKNVLVAITGVAGSGKSSLVCNEFVNRYPQAIVIDQKPVGSSSRSNPATYTGIMDDIRKLFAKANGVGPEWFSFNSKGACPVCKGRGEIAFEMAFAEPVIVTCEECHGCRYNKKSLAYAWHGKNIVDVLALTIDEAVKFLDDEKIHASLKGLVDVGLGYLTLGQPTSTLSGGESQRVKLAAELFKKGNVYILDEPTSGLHSRDVARLLALLRRLVAQHNTVIVAEHSLEMIAQADWIIDMGPDGGSKGGKVIFMGTPDKLVACPQSRTGQYLLKEST